MRPHATIRSTVALAFVACAAMTGHASAGVLPTRAAPLPESAFTKMPDGGETAPNTTSSDCLSGYVCWYGDANYSGWLQRYADVQTGNIAYPDQMSSWINRSPHAASWFTGSNGAGAGHCMQTNTGVAQLLASENDTMVSFKIYSGTGC